MTVVLRRTFLHFTKIGERRERHLWRIGYRDWEDLLSRNGPDEFRWCWATWQTEAERSETALERGDASFFADRLARSFWWRVVPEFRSRTLFLDIETTGLTGADCITLIGVYDGRDYQAFYRRDDWDELREKLASSAVLVTYNGALFDLPILRSVLPDWRFPPLHLDLCPLLRRIGYRGGLKGVEKQLGIQRSPETAELNGWDAVRLWWRWADYGDGKALELLTRYNREDVVHLSFLLDFAYETLWKSTVGKGVFG